QVTHRLNVVTSGQLSSQSRLIGETLPALSKLLSVAAWRINPSSAARHAMLAAAARPGIAVLPTLDGVNSVAFSPDGTTLPDGDEPGNVKLGTEPTNQQPSPTPPPDGLSGAAAVFSPDGRTLVIGSFDGSVRFWHVAPRQQAGGPLTSHNGGTSMAIS